MTTKKNGHVRTVLPAKGVEWLHNPNFNKGTAFTDA